MTEPITLTSGVHELAFVGEEMQLYIRDGNCDVLLRIEEGGHKTLKVDVKNAKCTLFLWNECEGEITLCEEYRLHDNADATLCFADVYASRLTRTVSGDATGACAKGAFHCAVLGMGEKTISIDTHNVALDSEMFMKNSAVVLRDATFTLEASGFIKKGAKRAKNFQESRALTLGQNKAVNIVPSLYVDENEVEAGHGCTIGDVDESILYYLGTRGLSKSDALALMIDSFLKTIANHITEEHWRDDVKTKIEKQVVRYAK